MAKDIIYGEEARTKLKIGVDKLTRAVATTLGPKGRNVGLDKPFGAPQVVHDGVTVAKEIELEDKFENMGAQLVRDAASKTNDVAGDGTTTATVLTQAIVEEGLRNVSAGANPMSLRSGLEKASKAVQDALIDCAQTISTEKEMFQVATISAQDPTIGAIVAEVVNKVGRNGVVTIDESKGFETEIKYKEGMQFERGYVSPYFVTNAERMESVVVSPRILITDAKITSAQDLVPMLDAFIKVSRDLVIIADEIDGEALALLIMNKIKGTINAVAIKSPYFGDRKKLALEDIAVLTGATVISEETGRRMDSVTVDDLGIADRVISDKDSTTIVGGKGNIEIISQRVEQIAAQIDAATEDYEKDKLQERLAKLSGGVAVIQVGAATESELRERKLRVEDALNATRVAVEGGIVEGAGMALLRAREVINTLNLTDDEKIGAKILYNALEKPARLILTNAGLDSGEILGAKALTKMVGFDVLKMKYVNLVKAGIIDPVKVTCSALQNAVSVATMILTIECLVSPIKEKDKNAQN